jgi:hypothetical protein
MSKLNLSRFKSGGRHTVVVKLPFEDPTTGKVVTEEMRVVYRGVSLRDSQEIEDRVNAAGEDDERKGLVAALCEAVIELPDLEDNGQPVQPSVEFFETLDTFFLNRIGRAIREDRQGPNS